MHALLFPCCTLPFPLQNWPIILGDFFGLFGAGGQRVWFNDITAAEAAGELAKTKTSRQCLRCCCCCALHPAPCALLTSQSATTTTRADADADSDGDADATADAAVADVVYKCDEAKEISNSRRS